MPDLILAQTVTDAFQALREFGVTVTVLAVMLAAFLWGVYKLREDNKQDRDRLVRLIDDQRTSFFAVLKEMQETERNEANLRREESRFVLAEQAKAFQDMLVRVETYWQRTTTEICRRLEELTDEIQLLRGGHPGKKQEGA